MKDLDRMETEADDDVVGCLPPILAPAHRQEIETIVNSLAETIEKGDLAIVENNLERYCKLLKLYQEQPNLLDAYIPELVEKLLKCVELPRADSPTKTLNDLSHAALEYLEHLTTVRGAKVISRLLPHEVSYLHRLLLTLENLSPLVEEGLRSRKMLLLWLWIVCKNPFDMRRFDRKDCPGSTLKQIFQVVEPYLSGMLSKCHYVAALVLSQCIARTDGLLMLNETVETCIRRLGSETDSLGGLILLTALLKHVDRQRIEPYVSRLVAAISPFFPLKSTNALVRKFFVKAVQRLALALLRPRLAAWRYRRGKRSLEESLAAVSSNGHGLGTNGAAKGLLEEEEENCDVSEHVEWVLGCLLEAIQDDDTGVRWSAAKGLGRICSRLPKELASQVVDAIVENNFHRLAGQCSWHGGCMSLAELSRRGFLLPATLPKVFDIVQEALFYEEPMGRQTLGANVRDAACYILWAFARAYEPEDLRPYLDRIATCLMCVTLFDREVRLRRAASAAFQENVGRQSNFPDGIALLTIVDYFAVGNRERCYTQIAIDVSKFAKYSSSLVDHLVERKVVHWDATVRQQTARALYELSAHHGEYLVTKVEQLLEGSASDSPIRRNGSIIALAHLIKGLQDSGHLIRDDQLKAAAQIPGHLRADFNNLRTGELTRVAVTEFIRVCSSVPIPLDEDQIGIWIALLETASVDRKPDFRAKAAAAAGIFMKSYLRPNSVIAIAAKKRIVKEIASTSQGEATRIGYCSLAASLPAEVLDEELFQALCDVLLRHGLSDKKWALAREAAVQAIAAVYLSKKHDLWTEKCFETLLRGLEDYTMDIHGDVGRFVRQEAMRALTDILTNATTPETVRESYVDLAVRKMVQQSAEKIGRVRETACNCIVTLLSSPLTSSHISQVPPLSDVYKDGRDFVQDKILTSLTPLLHCPEYYTDIVQGLVLSAGGMSEITGRYSAEAFQVYQEATSDDLEKTERLVGTVADLVDQGMKNTRILDAVLRFLPQLLRRLPSEDSYVDKSAGLSRILSRLKSLLSLPKLSPGRMKLVLSALSSLLLLSASSQTWQTAMQLLAGALSNPLPIIRRAAAESLLESIWATEIDERVVILLSETHWQDSGELEEIVKAAEEIQSLLVQI